MTTADSPRGMAFREALNEAALHEGRGDHASAFASLERAHVLGQTDFGSHWHVHVRMLRVGWARRDMREVLGQLLRLALVPIGHGVGRLPVGNTGGSKVSAFRSMPVAADLQRLLSDPDR
jgi:hypothetical protein